MKPKNIKTETQLIHAGVLNNACNAQNSPIYRTSTFVFENADQGAQRFLGKEDGFIYSRLGNPTNRELEVKLACLEKSEDCAVTSSGMGAIASCMWTFLKSGDHLLADNSLYGCTFALFTHCLSRFGIQVDLIDFANLDAVKKAIKPNTRIVYFETPTNPTLKVNDIKAIAEIVHNANKDIKVIVDNTFATPLLQKPIELGANIVVHSMTKYINGHGDIIAGCACGSAKDIGEIKMVGIKDATGSVLGADDAYMVNRGLRTLSIRLKKHISNTKQIIAYLQKSPFIKTIYYPGLDTTIGHDAATKQMSDFGAVLSFETNLTFEQTKALVNNVKIITLAVSLGSTESLIEHPASMTHSTYTPEALKEAGISPTLIRLSVGIEDADDLINDLDQAFKIAAK